MLSKLSLSLTAALALSASSDRVARAATVPTSTDDARGMVHSPRMPRSKLPRPGTRIARVTRTA